MRWFAALALIWGTTASSAPRCSASNWTMSKTTNDEGVAAVALGQSPSRGLDHQIRLSKRTSTTLTA